MPAYDPLDTLEWMLSETRRGLHEESFVDDKGRERKKSRALREAERIRFETLCEVLWNVQGRPGPLEEITEQGLLAA